MIDKKPWWLTEENISEYSKQQKKAINEWLKNEFKYKEIKEKEDTIIESFKKEINIRKEKIKIIEIEIKELERECEKCLVKIYNGVSGLKDIFGEENTSK